MASWTTGEVQIASESDLKSCWSGAADGKRFRCYLCGYKFQIGDKWRWVYAASVSKPNLLTCEKCDGEDVLLRWVALHAEFNELHERFWWFFHTC